MDGFLHEHAAGLFRIAEPGGEIDAAVGVLVTDDLINASQPAGIDDLFGAGRQRTQPHRQGDLDRRFGIAESAFQLPDLIEGHCDRFFDIQRDMQRLERARHLGVIRAVSADNDTVQMRLGGQEGIDVGIETAVLAQDDLFFLKSLFSGGLVHIHHGGDFIFVAENIQVTGDGGGLQSAADDPDLKHKKLLIQSVPFK